jgi:GAF domain-containing protein
MLPEESQLAPSSSVKSIADGIVDRAVAQVRRMSAAGRSQRELLTCLAAAAETISAPDATVSILVLDEEGLLRNGASPNLPAEYLMAIDRLKPDANVGTCAAAAATGCAVITPDFFADDKWAELRHLPSSLGFIGAWSMPIKTQQGTVLGTFGTYFRERRFPTPREWIAVEALAEAAAEVLTAR